MPRSSIVVLIPVLLVACAHPPAAVETIIRPETADPAADYWLEDQLAIDPRTPGARRLVVFFVGANSKPQSARPMMRELAAMGFHVVAPMYANDYGIVDACAPATEPDEGCHHKARLEAFEGQDHSPHIVVSPPNSAEGRITAMLRKLRWAAFFDGGRPRWEDIVVAGHSHGASSAGLVAKVRKVHRVVMLSGPFDNRGGRPVPWLKLLSATPLDRFYGFSHLNEEQHRGHLRDWEAMGLGALGPAITVESAAPPYRGSHQLVTALAPVSGKKPHGVTVAGSASPKGPDGRFALLPVWRTLFGR